jgi:AcrR family transcriptional regulator
MEISVNTEMRDKIILACKKVFEKKHFSDISMDDFAKATKMGRSSLYYYFKNKFEVFKAIALIECMDVMKHAFEKTSAKNTLSENFIIFYSNKIKALTKLTTNRYPYILEDVQTIPELFRGLMDETMACEKKTILRFLDWAISSKEITHVQLDDLEFLSYVIVNTFKAIEFEIFLYGKTEFYENRIEWTSKILTKGLT